MESESSPGAGANADARFVGYYSEESTSEKTRQRFEGVRRVVLKTLREVGAPVKPLDLLDVGCGAGTQTLLWARLGHRAKGIDVSAPLIEVARQRAQQEANVDVEFRVGSATELPVETASCDVVLVSELLEHLPDWEPCVAEAIRVLRPGGVLYFSTTNRLCPVQQEFALPFYSWYPKALKRRCERLSVTTHRHWVQYASYPAVHWFTFYQLRDRLAQSGLISRDRFDVMERKGSRMKALTIVAISRFAALRFIGHMLTPYTVVVGYRPAA